MAFRDPVAGILLPKRLSGHGRGELEGVRQLAFRPVIREVGRFHQALPEHLQV